MKLTSSERRLVLESESAIRRAAGGEVLSLYGGMGLWVKIQALQRWVCTPYMAVERFVPGGGVIVDLGCGTGMFANYMAMAAPGRRVTGIDLSEGKVRRAKQTVGDRKNISFEVKDLKNVDIEKCDGITIYDVLHHINRGAQEALLGQCMEKLKDGGRLVIKENCTKPLWKHLVNYLIEFAAVGFRVTKGEGLHFRSNEDWEALLKRLGFSVRAQMIPTWHAWSHVVFVCGKNGWA